MKYYIAQYGQAKGPFEPHELLQQGLTAQSQVWNESMTAWTPAGQVPELAQLLNQSMAPQMPPQQSQYAQPQYGGAQASAQYAANGAATGVARPQMSFMEAVKTCVVDKYCNFSGRARRSEFWWYILAYQILSWIVSGLTFSLNSVNAMDYINDPTAFAAAYFSSPTGIINVVVTLALLLPTLGVYVRRLHDTGRSGLWLLLFLVPCVNLVFIIIFIVWACQDSQPIENEYGPSPKYQ